MLPAAEGYELGFRVLRAAYQATGRVTARARRIPLTLARQIEDPVDLEALHLGVAALLPAAANLLDADRAYLIRGSPACRSHA